VESGAVGQFGFRRSNSNYSLAPVVKHPLSEQGVNSLEGRQRPFLVQHRHDLANSAPEFRELSLGGFARTSLKVGDNRRAPFPTKPQKLLARVANPLAHLL